jgi:tRNA/rRNA methyltransferase
MSDLQSKIKILLTEPEGAANLGYVARIMANTGFHSLVFTGSLSGREEAASRYAVNSSHILDNAVKRSTFKELVYEADTIIGFSPRNPWNDSSSLSYRDFAPKVQEEIGKGNSVGLLFGNEARGLSNDELAMCKYRVALPTDEACPSMNLSHAVLAALWELRTTDIAYDAPKHEITPYASTESRMLFMDKFTELLEISGYIGDQNSKLRLREINTAFTSKDWTEREISLLTSITGKLLKEIKYLKTI